MARYGEGPRISLALWARALVASTVAARLADKAAPAAKKKIRFMARSSRDDDAGRPDSNQVEDDVDVAARRLRVRTGLLGHGSLPFAFMRLACADGHRSDFGNVDDGLGKGLRGFLGQIVPDAAGDGPVRISAREFLGIGAGVRVWCAIGITFHRNRRHGDARGFGKP